MALYKFDDDDYYYYLMIRENKMKM